MFGIDAPIWAAGISGLANLGGGLMSSAGQASANQANIEMQRQANQQTLNAQQAQHEQNTAFQEDAQANSIFQQDMAQQFNSAEAEKARLFNSNEANTARNVQNAFSERMASTQYQRAMSDMRAAGLNPILAYQQGGNAAPQGSAGQASGPAASGSGGGAGQASGSPAPHLGAAHVLNDKDLVGRALGSLVNSALDASKSFRDIELTKEQTDLAKEKQQTERNVQRNLHVDSAKKVEETFKTNAEIENTKAANKLIQADVDKSRAHSAAAYASAGVDSQRSEQYRKYGRSEAPDTVERALRIGQSATENSVLPWLQRQWKAVNDWGDSITGTRR